MPCLSSPIKNESLLQKANNLVTSYRASSEHSATLGKSFLRGICAPYFIVCSNSIHLWSTLSNVTANLHRLELNSSAQIIPRVPGCTNILLRAAQVFPYYVINVNHLGYKDVRVRKSLTARLASPWATASSGSGIYRLEDEACTSSTQHLVIMKPKIHKTSIHKLVSNASYNELFLMNSARMQTMALVVI